LNYSTTFSFVNSKLYLKTNFFELEFIKYLSWRMPIVVILLIHNLWRHAKMAKATLKDIAERAGVSSSTASLVLSNKGKISDEVKQKIVEIADELGYSRRSPLSENTKGKIAVLFHFDSKLAHTWHVLRQVTLQIEQTLTNHNYVMMLVPITYEMDDDQLFSRVMALGASAVFSMHFGRESLFARLENASVPVVVIINSHFQSKFYTVCADNFQGSYEAASHLINLGHRKIIYADFNIHELPETLIDRYFGFSKALNEHNIPFSDDQKLRLDVYDLDGIRNQFKALRSSSKKPTAIFFVDDYLAARCYNILLELGYRIPEDLSIIASGEVLDYNEPFIPRITGMHTSPELLGKFSAEMMIDRLKHKPRESYVLKIRQQLMKRGSCKDV
jgi:LacI family transcriptional regulator